MKNFQFSIFSFQIVVIAVLLFLPVFVFADQAGSQDFVYLLHLYYDNGQLFVDREFKFKYDVIPEEFIPETLKIGFPYKGEIINLKGEVAQTFQFDPRQGNPKFLKGKISVKAPYISDGQKANFYDGQGNQLLSIFISESSFCNDDGVCNSDVGEDTKTCPSDCKPSNTMVPIVLPSTEPSTGGGGSGMLKGIIYLIIGLGVLGGWWYWKRKNQSPKTEISTYLPPPLPGSQNPV